MLEMDQIEAFYPSRLRPFRRCLLREYLQLKMLEAISDLRHAKNLCFIGGTCIHLVHGSARFSEDLDFDNRGLSEDAFAEMSEAVARSVALEGYKVELKNTFGQAYRAFLRFPDILQGLGLSGHGEEKMLIQVGAERQHFDYLPEDVILNKFDVFCRSYVAPVGLLLAQKIHCILERRRTMGRDFYDVVFLLGKTDVDMVYVKEKLGLETREDLGKRLLMVCDGLDLRAMARDVEPFLFSETDVKRVLMFPDYIRQTLLSDDRGSGIYR